MRYEFVKYVYNITDFSTTKDTWKSKEMKQLAKEIINNIDNGNLLERMRYAQEDSRPKFFNDLLKQLKELDYKDENGEFRKRDDYGITFAFGEKQFEKTLERRYLYFVYFLLIQSGLYQGNNVELFSELSELAGYDYDEVNFPYMGDAIFYYVLKTNQDSNALIELLKSWEKHVASQEENLKLSYSKLVNQGENSLEVINYRQLEQIVKEGMEENDNTAATRHSLSKIETDLEMVIANSEKKNLKKSTDITEIFPVTLCTSINNTEVRRQWYFFKLIHMIVDKQIKEIVECVERYRTQERNQQNTRKELIKLFRNSWLEKEDHVKLQGTWMQIAKEPEKFKEYDKLELQELLKQSRIKIGHVTKDFNEYFEGNLGGMAAFEKYEERIYTFEISEYFKKVGVVEKRNKVAPRNIEQHFRQLLTQKSIVSREMLLLSCLMAKVKGVDIRKEYVQGHILFNSRCTSKLYVDTSVFDSYFETTFDELAKLDTMEEKIQVLKKHSSEMERSYLRMGKYEDGGIAIFHNALKGGRLI